MRSRKPFPSHLVPLTSHLIREAFQQPACKSGVAKHAGRDEWSITSASHQPSPQRAVGEGCRARARSAEAGYASTKQASAWQAIWTRSSISRALRCLREGEGANPFESANLPWVQMSRDAAHSSLQNQAPGAFQNAGASSAWCSSNMLRSGRSERECKSLRADQFHGA